eukprot:CAMPEP_0113315652 /NCGR_PEP_ID=MMETSP0010_2-20120614/11236_1 /TAXON_ID=216773 ORGANISM="Corethron hystrix, Strain 308" /NCGR_SAMPLE_ID=MMETSP0010_2 /ASSEMBLY_ACC=CAM_ASM_000155 /LENGTH=376 /DNA_ID=CAMNT_0000172199 /DNA_START=334 /DNA_END=1463 /DNA_ORIENTATION=+ /assembly_acc=CAM_ASM_000155
MSSIGKKMETSLGKLGRHATETTVSGGDNQWVRYGGQFPTRVGEGACLAPPLSLVALLATAAAAVPALAAAAFALAAAAAAALPPSPTSTALARPTHHQPPAFLSRADLTAGTTAGTTAGPRAFLSAGPTAGTTVGPTAAVHSNPSDLSPAAVDARRSIDRRHLDALRASRPAVLDLLAADGEILQEKVGVAAQRLAARPDQLAVAVQVEPSQLPQVLQRGRELSRQVVVVQPQDLQVLQSFHVAVQPLLETVGVQRQRLQAAHVVEIFREPDQPVAVQLQLRQAPQGRDPARHGAPDLVIAQDQRLQAAQKPHLLRNGSLEAAPLSLSVGQVDIRHLPLEAGHAPPVAVPAGAVAEAGVRTGAPRAIFGVGGQRR